MAKTKISEYDAVASNNTDVDSVNIAEGCAPSGINNAIREVMAHLKDFQAGTNGDPFNGPVNGTVGATTPAAGAFTTLTASSTATLNTLASSGATLTGGSINNMAIGGTTAAAGAFTTLSASGAVTLSGGTANGVPYLNGSKVLTSGSALTFDGTTLYVGATLNNSVSFSRKAEIIDGLLLHGIATAAPNLYLHRDDATIGNGDSLGVINFSGADSGSFVGAAIEAESAGTWSASSVATDLKFFTTNGGSTTTTEKMRINSSGNVGIGTSSPAQKLHVNSGTANNVALFESTDGTALAVFKDSATTLDIGVGAISNNLVFVNSSERARIDSSGNLGLGVTPSAWQSVYRTIQTGVSASFSGRTDTSGLELSSNAYRDSSGTRRYINTSYASDYRQYSGAHEWYTAPSGTAGNAISFTQAMTLDASGNLGIGTTSALGKLHVRGTAAADMTCRLEPVNNSYASKLLMSSTSSGDGGIQYGASGGNDLNVFTYNNITFLTGAISDGIGTERARIDSSGNLLVGTTTTSPGYGNTDIGSRVSNTQANFSVNSTDWVITVNQNGSDGGSRYMIGFRNSNTNIGGIVGNGSSTSYNTSSDYRLKEDWVAVADASTRVNALKPVNFAWKATGTRVDGFLAHELAEVVPEAVTGEKDAVDADGNPVYQGIDQSKLVPLLTAALQEALAKIESLTARVSALE